jgi:hypothetical protein
VCRIVCCVGLHCCHGGFLSSLFNKGGPKLAPGEEASGQQVRGVLDVYDVIVCVQCSQVMAASGENGRATVVLCYGYVCAYGPPVQVRCDVTCCDDAV